MKYLERVTIIFNPDGTTKTIEGIDLEKLEGRKDYQHDVRTVVESDKDFATFLQRFDLQALADRDAAKAAVEQLNAEHKAELERVGIEYAAALEKASVYEQQSTAKLQSQLQADREQFVSDLAALTAELGTSQADLAAAHATIARCNEVIQSNTVKMAEAAETIATMGEDAEALKIAHAQELEALTAAHTERVTELEAKIADDETIIEGLAETNERIATEFGDKMLEAEKTIATMEGHPDVIAKRKADELERAKAAKAEALETIKRAEAVLSESAVEAAE